MAAPVTVSCPICGLLYTLSTSWPQPYCPNCARAAREASRDVYGGNPLIDAHFKREHDRLTQEYLRRKKPDKTAAINQLIDPLMTTVKPQEPPSETWPFDDWGVVAGGYTDLDAQNKEASASCGSKTTHLDSTK